MAAPNISGENIEVYRKDDQFGTKYSLRLNINKDGIWLNEYIQLQLPLGTDIPNKSRINILKGYITFYPTKNGNKFKIVCTDFDILNNTPIGNIDLSNGNVDDGLPW